MGKVVEVSPDSAEAVAQIVAALAEAHTRGLKVSISGARHSMGGQTAYLDGQGYAVRIMQSNNPFTVGGTLSVNAHGWQHNQPPFVSRVDGFRLMTADGAVKNCSRSENAELFKAAAGVPGALLCPRGRRFLSGPRVRAAFHRSVLLLVQGPDDALHQGSGRAHPFTRA